MKIENSTSLLDRTINNLHWIIVKFDEQGTQSFKHWYNIAYSVIFSAIHEGIDIPSLEKFCIENDNDRDIIAQAFRSASKAVSIQGYQMNSATTISTQIYNDISLCRYLLDKLTKEVKYYESIHKDKKAS